MSDNIELYAIFDKYWGAKRGGIYSSEGIARNVASGWDDEDYGKRYEKQYPSAIEAQKYEIRKLAPVFRTIGYDVFTLDMEWVRV